MSNIPMKKKGLIIQGPIVSEGRTGQTGHVPLKKVTKNDIINFNCIDTIEKIFNDFKNDFTNIIFVTWTGQDKALEQALIERIGEDNILFLTDDTKDIAPKNTIIAANNKYRQFYSMLKGLEHLQEKGCDFAVKVRADQYGDYACLANNVDKYLTKHPHKILVPWFNPHSINQLPDFYFGGNTSNLIRLCDDYLSRKEIHSLVHIDLFYQWSFACEKATPLRRALVLITKTLSKKSFHRYFIRNAWRNYFTPFDQSVHTGLYWRGEKVLPSPKLVFAEQINEKGIEYFCPIFQKFKK